MSIGFLKLSILALYGSIFPSSRFHQSLWALGVFTALWTSMSVIGAICQCVPIESYWDDSIEGHCIEYAILQLISSVCNITTDFVILFLPIGQIRRLHVSKGKKRWIYLSLAMGGRYFGPGTHAWFYLKGALLTASLYQCLPCQYHSFCLCSPTRLGRSFL